MSANKPRIGAALVAILSPVAVSLTVPGCDAVPAPGDGTVMRDSAGLVIVENDPALPAWGDGGWTLDPDPVLAIGAVDAEGPEQLHRVTHSRFLPGGEIAVVNTHTAEVRIFGPDGRHLRSLGGTGDGPGEFRSPWQVHPHRDDSLFVVDLYRSVSVFDPGGGYARQFVPGGVVGESQGPPRGQFGDGSLLFMRYQRGDPSEIGIVRTQVELVRIGFDGEEIMSYGLFNEQTVRRGGGQYIFGPRAEMAPGESDLYYAPGDRLEVRRIAPDGRIARLIRLDLDPRPVTQADRDAWMDMLIESNPDTTAERFRRMWGELESPPYFPRHGRILGDDREHLWVDDYPVPGKRAPSRWSVFDPEGRYLGEVSTPAGFIVHQCRGRPRAGTMAGRVRGRAHPRVPDRGPRALKAALGVDGARWLLLDRALGRRSAGSPGTRGRLPRRTVHSLHFGPLAEPFAE